MNTLFEKIWEAHVVQTINDGPTQLYIDRFFCHEVTSPQAFDGLRKRWKRGKHLYNRRNGGNRYTTSVKLYKGKF